MSHDLDLLKKHWQEENHFKKYSEQELFIMTKKKSLSIPQRPARTAKRLSLQEKRLQSLILSN